MLVLLSPLKEMQYKIYFIRFQIKYGIFPVKYFVESHLISTESQSKLSNFKCGYFLRNLRGFSFFLIKNNVLQKFCNYKTLSATDWITKYLFILFLKELWGFYNIIFSM